MTNTIKLYHWTGKSRMHGDGYTTYRPHDADDHDNYWIDDGEDYVLPSGYSVGETIGVVAQDHVVGEIGVFDADGRYCAIETHARHGNQPVLVERDGVVTLHRAAE